MNRRILILTLQFLSVALVCPGEDLPLRTAFPRSCFNEDLAIDARIAIGVFAANVSDQASEPAKGVIIETDRELLEMIEAGKTDLFAINPDVYLASASDLDITPILISATASSPIEQLLLIARKGDGFSDLKGGALIIDISGRGDTPERWISEHLRSSGQGENAERYFDSVEVEKVITAARALLPVYFGKKDAAILSQDSFDAMCDLNPEMRGDLNVVCRSKPVASTLICLRRGSGHRASDLVRIGEKLHRSERGKQLLRLMGASKLVPFKDEYLLYDRLIHNRAASGKRKGDQKGAAN